MVVGIAVRRYVEGAVAKVGNLAGAGRLYMTSPPSAHVLSSLMKGPLHKKSTFSTSEAVVATNAFKGGTREVLRSLARALREQMSVIQQR